MAAADTACPGGALACCAISGNLTCDVAGGCTLGTTKVAHAHAAGLGVVNIEMDCAFGGGVELLAASCTATAECTQIASNGIGGNLRCIVSTLGADGYCAVFP
ncbi:MAG TPA: hypothetical protein VGR28_00460 [Candidatus Thermoplasmatota archaeon]|nr:hypothetical protein [Candidatus Thermoplasmatota archaeon]